MNESEIDMECRKSTLHRNIKINFFMYFSLALMHSVAYPIAQIQAVISSLVNKPCDFFPPLYIYAPLHLCIFASNFGLMVSLVAICIERCVATIRSSKYERSNNVLGVMLLAFTIVGTVLVLRYVYHVDDFNVRVWSIVVLPPGSIEEGRKIVIVYVIVSMICVITFFVSSRINRRRCIVGTATLTTRYQTRENVITTEFAYHITGLQVLFFTSYAFMSSLARSIGDNLFQMDLKVHIIVRHAIYVVPIFMLVLPIYSMRRLKYYQRIRDDNIRSIVRMECRGVAGTQNYETIITKTWQLNS
ncbi:integral membrane protein Srb [Dictyocaulus viviparus]|uniref:Integral membrane protein Srb n=1 Tax=Dictyocaulus viviparus TaxID=29172 RepID=A0A0D8XVG9_DICVI|nr:integral membrane protein Srb [Dictyocaulus viviparus]